MCPFSSSPLLLLLFSLIIVLLNLAPRVKCDVDCGAYLAVDGSDTTGNGSTTKPFKSVGAAISLQRNKSSVVVCFMPGNYTMSQSVLVPTNLSSLELRGAGTHDVVLHGFQIDSGENLTTHRDFTLALNYVTLDFVSIGSKRESYFPTVVFSMVNFQNTGNKLTDGSWLISAKNVSISHSMVTGSISQGFIINSTPINATQLVVNGSLMINNLTWANVVSPGIKLKCVNSVVILNSIFKMSAGPIFSVLEDDTNNDSYTNVLIKNVIFSNNSFSSNESLLSFPLPGNITVLNSSFLCNGRSPFYPPISTSNQSYIIITNLTLNPSCPIQCPSVGTYLVSSIFNCLPCPGGSFSHPNYTCEACPNSYYVNSNNECEVCPSGQFADDNLGCLTCPVFSTQPAQGKNFCTCFTGVKVFPSYVELCNDHFWGFIVAAVYLLVIVLIVLVWRNKNRALNYTELQE